ncbi:MAG: response regulator [Deltaproteobacteria bacterium]|nr:response regulator [Deltaproteobacteria bacterium]
MGDVAKPIVLAVDDTPANLDVLSGILCHDYKVKVAINGATALEFARREPRPDIILLDVMMPEMSGYEVCERLKGDAETASIPIIFITAKSEVEDEQMGLSLGAVDYITKPFHHEIVKARVRRHLAGHQETRELIEENRELRANKPRGFTDFDEPSVVDLIRAGEGHSVEFKSTLRWNLHADRVDKNIETASLKTVAGYLNTDGGVLLVGVTDEGKSIGLDKDGFKSEDKLLLHWVNLLTSSLGAQFMRSIRSTLHTVGEQRVLLVECLPAKAPVFVKRDNDESFYVRMTNSTQALKPSEVLTYIGQHFADDPSSGGGMRNTASRGATASPSELAEAGVGSIPLQEAPGGRRSPGPSGWFHKLKERHVIRTGLLYIVVAFGFIEIALLVAETLDAPGWLGRALVLGFIAGFPLVVMLSWAYDLRVTRTGSDVDDR